MIFDRVSGPFSFLEGRGILEVREWGKTEEE